MKTLIIALTFLPLIACTKDRVYKEYTFWQELKVLKGFYIGCKANITQDNGSWDNGVRATVFCQKGMTIYKVEDKIICKDDLE
jgi:hypothetical protein